ncbi:recombinase family protein [Streptomyces sp. NBC_00154]|uniref:recombinase family protein n=1 Tax=Streptomyces sp. NBC_00154 TaxID=2975670 RepID=UPI002257AFA8|nr:recombinase family protein [Streptomyces sp. NBC_00154]MCX5309710.1 recombinase family protein [Streptomyces sp. NBC_00154]
MTLFRAGGLYLRISKDEESGEDGVTRQREDTDELAMARGIPVAAHHRYVDNDLSASHGKPREAYGRLMEAVKRGEIDVILVTYLSRLWRNRRERAEGMEILRKHNVSVLCVKGPELNLSTASGRMLAGVLGEVDTFEVEQMAERQQRETLQRIERGVAPTGPRCFGYTPDGSELVHSEAWEIRGMFEQLLAGATVSGIAAGLNERKVGNRNGKPWSHNAVRGLLLNERVAGLREYRGETYAGTWPTVVDEVTWREAVAILTDEARRTSPGPARRWLLSGIALCGVCADGTTMTSAQRDSKNGPGENRIYRCRRVKHVARLAEPIDQLIAGTEPGEPLGVVLQLLMRPDAAALLVDSDRPDAEDLKRTAATLRARLDGLADAFADDDEADPQDFKRAARRIRGRLAETEAKMAHPQRASILADLVTADDVVTEWQGLVLDRKRAVVDTLITITIHPAGPGRRAFDPRSVKIEARF